jgi:glucose/arabinose dehydrogenase
MRSTFALGLVTLAVLSACADSTPTAITPAALSSTASANRTALVTQASVSVVMSHLDSPRGLAWGPEGALYVAEAGTPAINGPCTPVPRGQSCYSGTGAISRLWKGVQERVASGLPSVFQVGPSDITGPHDISFQGKGNAYVTIGWGAPPAARAGLGELGKWFGTLIRLTPNGAWSVVADIAGFEQANNPAGGPLDSNPYGVLAESGREFLTDAGGNSLLQVTANGEVSAVTTFPPTASGADAVPTEVVRGPDGALYVSTLTGVPFIAGAASIWRVVPGAAPQVYAGGFKTITDFDWGPDGSLYVLQYASSPTFFGQPGLLIRVAPDGQRTVLNSALTNPTGVLVGPDGAIYVSNKGNVAGVGEVLRIVP